MLSFWFKIPLWQRVIGALILGIAVGFAWGPEAETIKWIGDFFIKAIKMLVVPLIFFSLVAGVASIGDLRKLGKVGGRAMILFIITGQIAAWLGLFLGTVIKPGSGLQTDIIEKGETPEPNETSAVDMILSIVPDSPGSGHGGCTGIAANRLCAADRHRYFDGQGGRQAADQDFR